MNLPMSLEDARHYKWGQNCDGWHLLDTPELSIMLRRMPPGTREKNHKHFRCSHLFYITEGTLEMWVDQKKYLLRATDTIEIAPEVPHWYASQGPGSAEFMMISRPPTWGDRVELD